MDIKMTSNIIVCSCLVNFMNYQYFFAISIPLISIRLDHLFGDTEH